MITIFLYFLQKGRMIYIRHFIYGTSDFFHGSEMIQHWLCGKARLFRNPSNSQFFFPFHADNGKSCIQNHLFCDFRFWRHTRLPVYYKCYITFVILCRQKETDRMDTAGYIHLSLIIRFESVLICCNPADDHCCRLNDDADQKNHL